MLVSPESIGMNILGPDLKASAQCEAILRSLPGWFGIEESLLAYARDTERLPTFAVSQADRIIAFLTLKEHFPVSWEINCIAVHHDARNKGIGRALLAHAEQWLRERDAIFLQVKTIAEFCDDANYAQTRKFYTAMGFAPLEHFPLHWSADDPCLQLVKFLRFYK